MLGKFAIFGILGKFWNTYESGILGKFGIFGKFCESGILGRFGILGKFGMLGTLGILGKLGILGEVRILCEIGIEYLARLEYLVRLNMILGRFGILGEVGIPGKFGILIYIVALLSVLDLLSSFAFPRYGSICVLTQLYCPSCLASPAFPCLDPLPPRRRGRPRRLSLRITRNIALRRYISGQARGAGKGIAEPCGPRGDIELIPTTIPLIQADEKQTMSPDHPFGKSQ